MAWSWFLNVSSYLVHTMRDNLLVITITTGHFIARRSLSFPLRIWVVVDRTFTCVVCLFSS